MIKVLNWAVGEVRFRAEGSAAERLVSRAVQRGITLRGMRRESGGICATVRADEYRRVVQLRHGIEARTRILQKRGLPFFLHRNRNRFGVPIGLMLFFGVIHLLSLFVWEVGIEGETSLSHAEILKVAAEFGLEEGSYLPELDLREMATNLSNALPQLSWVSVNASGSRVFIKLHDRVIAPEIVPEDEPCNIKAKTDGVVVRMETARGQEVAQPGKTVLKGDLLVSGVWESTAGETVLYHAQAKVYAKTAYLETVRIPLEQTLREETGKTVERVHLWIFGIELPLNLSAVPEGGLWERSVSVKKINWNGTILPVKIFREIWREEMEQSVLLSEGEARQQAQNELEKRIRETYAEKTVQEVEKTWKVEGKELILYAKVRCEEDIAQESPIYLEEKTEKMKNIV